MKVTRLHAWNYKKEVKDASGILHVVLLCENKSGKLVGEEKVKELTEFSEQLDEKLSEKIRLHVLVNTDYPAFIYENRITGLPKFLLIKNNETKFLETSELKFDLEFFETHM